MIDTRVTRRAVVQRIFSLFPAITSTQTTPRQVKHSSISLHPLMIRQLTGTEAGGQIASRITTCLNSAVAETDDRLATTDMGRKVGGAVPISLGGAGSTSNTMWPGRGLPSYQVAS